MTPTTIRALALAGVTVMGTIGSAQAPGVQYFPAADVEASFAKGGTLTDVGSFRVTTASRTAGGDAELHANHADIFHVLEGSATFVTGGTLVGAHDTAPGETRGSALEGGTTLTLKAGDVITIEAGVPHWFKAVDGHVRYFVVKVRRS